MGFRRIDQYSFVPVRVRRGERLRSIFSYEISINVWLLCIFLARAVGKLPASKNYVPAVLKAFN